MRPSALLLLSILPCTIPLCAAEPPPDYRYKVETLLEGMPQPMELQFAPDGRLFFIEIEGKVKIFHYDTKQAVEAATLKVFNQQENGLLGMALDPDFARNGFIYLLYSPTDFSGQRLSRFEAKGDSIDLASEKQILTYEEQRKECCHHAGCVRFGPDGCLYFSAGDNTNPFASDGFAPLDERPGRNPWDSQKSAANPNDLRGKINRIKPTLDGRYTIPPGNLFPPGTPGTRPEIYVMGCRNPWRFNFDPKTGILYYGDVGNDAGGDSAERGPRGYDDINQVTRAANFGWPYFRANNQAYAAYDFEAKKAGAKYDPLHPVNNSPNNTGRHDLPPAQPAWIYYPYAASKEFPELGKEGRCACAGPVYRWQAAYEKTGGLPRYYDNCVLIYDWQRPFIKWVRLDARENRVDIEDFTKALTYKRPVDMIIGPDGALWLLEYGETWGANKDSALRRISFQAGHLAPVAAASAKNASGREPLAVDLSAEGSRQMEGEPLTYQWKLQPGGAVVATTASARVTIPQPGNYIATLEVKDTQGAVGTASVPITVGNTAPDVRFESPKDGQFFGPGDKIQYKVSIRDVEDGDSTSKPDEFAARTFVSASWKTADGKGSATDPGLALMKQSDCFNCHAIDQQVVGPPLVKIAEKYRGQSGAESASVQRVIKGSTGVWGQVGMLAHAQHTEDEVHIMVRWIYGLEPGKAAPGLARGLAGEVEAPKDGKTVACILEASYTDLGRPPANPLTGKAVVHLRSRRLEAELADEIHGPKLIGEGSASGGKVVGSISDGNYIKYAGIDLAGIGSVRFRVSSGGEGGKINVRAGSPSGEVLATAEVVRTGGWDKFIDIDSPLASIPPLPQDIFIVFQNPGKGGLMNLDWVQFNKEAIAK